MLMSLSVENSVPIKNAHFARFIPGGSDLTGATNLMAYYGLEHSYSKFSGKKVKSELSSFLPNLPGFIDGPGQNVSNKPHLNH